MKRNNIKYLLTPLLIAGFINCVHAQSDRSHGGSDRGNGVSRGSEQRVQNNNNNVQRPERSSIPQAGRTPTQPRFDRGNTPQTGGTPSSSGQPRYNRGNMPQAGSTPVAPQPRIDRGNTPQRGETPQRIAGDNGIQRNNNTRDINRSNRDNTINRGNRNSDWQRNDRQDYSRNNRTVYSSRPYSSGRYGYNRVYVPSRHIYIGAPRYSIIPHGSISISFGGNPYYYNSGFFYNYYDGFYNPVFPPFGIRVGMLPYGYSPFYVGPDMFYYYNGIYYRQYDNQNYEVVDAPMGAQVSSLPKGAKSVMVNGEKFYELNGTYYKEDRDSKGKTVYTVVGKNGEIDNTDEPETQAPTLSYKIGDIITDLPEGSKLVTIKGEKLFVTPDETYFKQQIEGNTSTYKVVGFAEENIPATKQM